MVAQFKTKSQPGKIKKIKKLEQELNGFSAFVSCQKMQFFLDVSSCEDRYDELECDIFLET